MHIADPSIGIFGANGIVAAGLPIAVGAAAASQLRADGGVAVAFFGDGAIAQGAFHEAMNLASVWQLPVVFWCENNGYAEFSPAATQTAATLERRASGYDVDYVGVINNYPIGTNKVVRSLPSRYQLLSEISQAADAGKKFFVASSTAHAATAIGEVLRSQGSKVLVVAASTSEHPEVIDFQKSPNDWATQYDVIVASPSLQTGFSIDGNPDVNLFSKDDSGICPA